MQRSHAGRLGDWKVNVRGRTGPDLGDQTAQVLTHATVRACEVDGNE